MKIIIDCTKFVKFPKELYDIRIIKHLEKEILDRILLYYETDDNFQETTINLYLSAIERSQPSTPNPSSVELFCTFCDLMKDININISLNFVLNQNLALHQSDLIFINPVRKELVDAITARKIKELHLVGEDILFEYIYYDQNNIDHKGSISNCLEIK